MTQRALIGLPQSVTSGTVTRQSSTSDRQSVVAGPAVVVLTSMPKGWKLRHPLTLQYVRDVDGTHLVNDAVFAVYGLGDSFGEAFRDYIASLIDYYELVSTSVSDAADERQFAYVQRYLQPSS